MSDGYERYSDYDHRYDEDEPLYPVPAWMRVTKVALRVLLIVICAVTVGVLAVRLIFAGWYPPFAKELFMTESLRGAYRADGTLSAFTQTPAVPYESRSTGYFRAANVLFLPTPGSLQCSIRVNRSSRDDIAAHAGVETDGAGDVALSFALYFGGDGVEERLALPTHVEKQTFFYYDYYKICFDGLSFEGVPWWRLNIHVAGCPDTEEAPFACIAVYENNEEYSAMTPYVISEKEYGP